MWWKQPWERWKMLEHTKHSWQHHTLSMAFPTRETLLWMSLWSEANFWTVSFILLQHCVKTSDSVPDNSASWPIKKERKKDWLFTKANPKMASYHTGPLEDEKADVKKNQLSTLKQTVTSIGAIFQMNSKKAILIFISFGIHFKILLWHKSLM